jgi:hypothetical protein
MTDVSAGVGGCPCYWSRTCRIERSGARNTGMNRKSIGEVEMRQTNLTPMSRSSYSPYTYKESLIIMVLCTSNSSSFSIVTRHFVHLQFHVSTESVCETIQ